MSNGVIARFFLLAAISSVSVLPTVLGQSDRSKARKPLEQTTLQLPPYLNSASTGDVPSNGEPSSAANYKGEARKSAVEIAEMNNDAIRLTRESRYAEAAELLRKVIAAAPYRFRLHRNLSIVYEHMNRMDEALRSARTAVDIAPDEPTALMQLCGLEFVNSRLAEAVECYERLRKIAPMDALSQISYGVALLRTGDAGRAVTVLEQAAAARPADIPALNALGLAYFQMQRYRDAAASFKHAVESDPERGEIRLNLAITYIFLRNKEGAISQYRMLKGENPELARRLYHVLFRDKVVSVEQLTRQ